MKELRTAHCAGSKRNALNCENVVGPRGGSLRRRQTGAGSVAGVESRRDSESDHSGHGRGDRPGGLPAQARNRRFFWAVLASVSVGGNILHALIVGPMPPVLAALIATVAPLSLLATTHGLAVLTRFNPEKEI